METGFCAVSIADGFIPGAANLDNPDPVCAASIFAHHPATAPRTVLKNSSGFGGSNVCLVLRRGKTDLRRGAG